MYFSIRGVVLKLFDVKLRVLGKNVVCDKTNKQKWYWHKTFKLYMHLLRVEPDKTRELWRKRSERYMFCTVELEETRATHGSLATSCDISEANHETHPLVLKNILKVWFDVPIFCCICRTLRFTFHKMHDYTLHKKLVAHKQVYSAFYTMATANVFQAGSPAPVQKITFRSAGAEEFSPRCKIPNEIASPNLSSPPPFHTQTRHPFITPSPKGKLRSNEWIFLDRSVKGFVLEISFHWRYFFLHKWMAYNQWHACVKRKGSDGNDIYSRVVGFKKFGKRIALKFKNFK